jgi:Integrase zinc binding domain
MEPYSILRLNEDGTIKYNHKQITTSLTVSDEKAEDAFKKAYQKDMMAQQLLKEPSSNKEITIQDGIILINRLIYVPQSFRQEIFNQYHEIKTAEHQGIDRTLELITRTYYFPKIKKFVEDRIRVCDAYQRNKTSRHKSYGKLMPNQAPAGAWKDMTLDFITKLPELKELITKTSFDSILVITDRLTKYGYFIPYKKSFSAEDLAYIFNKHIIGNYGIPKKIISDRDKLFTSRFWKSLMD